MNAVVTGASKGLGKAIAYKLAEEKYNLFLVSRNKEELKIVASQLDLLYKVKVFYLPCDVSNKDEISFLCSQIKQNFESIDVLINNAGQFIPGSILNQEDNLENQMNINLYSAYYITRGLITNIFNSQNAHIFNMCSIASKFAYPNGGSYSISKFALLGFSKVLREELKDKNIKVTAILPGATWSDSWKNVDLPYERLMEADDIAKTIISCLHLSASACVEEIILRPQLGDL
jgi:short-subunit dehydrogenase